MISVLKLRTSFFVLLAVFAGVVFFASRATAEHGRMGAKAASLPAQSQAVIDRLSSLRALPDGAWKMHSGDLAHGEAVNLDESSWQPIARGGKAPKDAVWFRQTYQVPRDAQRLRPDRRRASGSSSTPTPTAPCRRFSTSTAAAWPWATILSPIVLFDDARPGDKVTVAVKLLHTVDAKTLRRRHPAHRLPRSRPNPEDLRMEFLSAALLVPSLAPGRRKHRWPRSTSVHPHRRPSAALRRRTTRPKFDASLKAAHAKLEALKPLLQQATFHLTGNSHIDAAWLWPWTETVDVVKRTFGTALQLMYEYPQYTYTQSAAAIQRVDGRQISRHERRDRAAHQGRPLGGRRRHVGRAGPEHARWRIARAPASGGQALVQAGLRRGRAHRLESRIPLATPGSCRRSTRRAASTTL